jgi:hypothetical protein
LLTIDIVFTILSFLKRENELMLFLEYFFITNYRKKMHFN